MPRNSSVDIVYVRSRGQGWGPVDAMVELAGRLISGTEPTIIEDVRRGSRIKKAAALLPPASRRGRAALLIVSNPAQLALACTRTHWLPGYECVGAWVIDSFWTEWTSRIARQRFPQHFDHIFITDGDLIEEWSALTSASVSWAAWGSDTLAQRAVGADRPVDVQRLGRQPRAWDDDEELVAQAAALGLVAAGRPPISQDGLANQHTVRRALERAKTTLAFSNGVNPEKYTHPTREYITGRWVDALAAGSVVAGVAPRCRTTRELLWDGATLDISVDDLGAGLATIGSYLTSWTPEVARRNHALARQRLDWRLRFAEIVDTMGIGRSDALRRELDLLALQG